MNDPTDLATDAPHPPLTDYYPGEQARRAWLRAIFNRTAADYERVDWVMSGGSGPRYRGQALLRAGLSAGDSVLDVGTGTGLVAKQALDIVGEHGSVTAVDPAIGMIAAGALPRRIRAVGGAGERLPFADARFDFVSMGYALRHVSDVRALFGELRRVLKPGGRLCLLEITPPQGRLQYLLLKLYMRNVVPVLSRLFARQTETPTLMRYYWDTIEACMPARQVLELLQAAGFEAAERHVELRIFSEYRAVKPED